MNQAANSQPDYSKTGTVVAMCLALFKVSAQCNKNINGYGDDVSILMRSFGIKKLQLSNIFFLT
jgi:hypothetical protein